MTIYSDYEGFDDIHLEEREIAFKPTILLSQLQEEQRDQIERTKTASAAAIIPHTINAPTLANATHAPEIPAITDIARREGILPSTVKSIFDLSAEPDIDRVALLEQAKENLEESLPIPRSDQEIVDDLTLSNEETIQQAMPKRFPNLALEIVMLGLKMEKYHTDEKLAVYKKEGDACKEKIDLLIKLSAQLPKMNSDNAPYAIKEETRAEIGRITEKLKAKGIDIFPGVEIGKEIPKEQMAAANSLINHHIDENKMSLQELFATKINVSIQFLQMMIEVMKKCIEYDARLKEKTFKG